LSVSCVTGVQTCALPIFLKSNRFFILVYGLSTIILS